MTRPSSANKTAEAEPNTKPTGATNETVIYEGKRSPNGDVAVTRRTHNASGTAPREKALPPRFDLRNHSPTGFEWGYGGSGPAQLALALLADALNDAEQALLLYQAFKWKTVALFPTEGWQISKTEVQRIVRVLQAEQGQHTAPYEAETQPAIAAPTP